MLTSLLNDKNFLIETFHCDAFERWSKLTWNDRATKDEIQDMKERLGSLPLWKRFEDVANIMKPILYVHSALDSKAPTTGKTKGYHADYIFK